MYRVSRSTLEKYPHTMLARMVDPDVWQQQQQEQPNTNTNCFFLDRNGERFQYVLDYMRDRKVFLPVTVNKRAFLSDLEYFGFCSETEEDHDSIVQGNLKEVFNTVRAVESNNEQDIDDLDKEIQALSDQIDLCTNKKAAIKVAHELFRRSKSEGSTSLSFWRGAHGTEALERYKNIECALRVKKYLKERLLENYGLLLTKVDIDLIMQGCKVVVEPVSK